jgi:hypothetical protein
MRIAWFHVISELEQSGITLRSQAEVAEVSLGTIYYWKSGGEPKYRNGEMLLNLYANTFGVEPPRVTSLSTSRAPVMTTAPVFQATASSTAW